MSLGLVVFSNINYLFIYLFIIYDVILIAFRIILSTWLHNYKQKWKYPQKNQVLVSAVKKKRHAKGAPNPFIGRLYKKRRDQKYNKKM